MNYFTKEQVLSANMQLNAGSKAREDINHILQSHGWKAVELISVRNEENNKKAGKLQKIAEHKKTAKLMDTAFADLKNGDTLLIQFPLLSHTLFGIFSIKKLKKRGVNVILLVHDLDMIRCALEKKSFFAETRINIEEKTLLKACSKIIVHNRKMKKALVSVGIDEQKMTELQIFDYLIPKYDIEAKREKTGRELPVIIAGNLRKNKAGYLYQLPETPDYNLYGIGYETEEQAVNIHYKGAFQPDVLPSELEGSFGLIWDGETSETCSGVYGNYLKINNPHKTSLYLASGIPVIIWHKAALAEFVLKNKCGIVVDSLHHIPEAISKLSDEEYRKMQENTAKLSEHLREGYFTMKALKNIS